MKKIGRAKSEEDICYQAWEQTDPVARNAFLNQACAGMPARPARIETLLAVPSEAEQFFAEAGETIHFEIEAPPEQ